MCVCVGGGAWHTHVYTCKRACQLVQENVCVCVCVCVCTVAGFHGEKTSKGGLKLLEEVIKKSEV